MANELELQDLYRIDLDPKGGDHNKKNWYKEKPYTFIFTDINGDKFFFNLPISPSNLTINTHFATNFIPTMYGTVEEHSEQRYFDISISGTTGMAPKYSDYAQIEELVDVFAANYAVKGDGRLSFKKDRSVLDKIGVANRTLNVINQTVSNASGAFNLFNKNEYKTGIFYQSTGYAAFHNFYRFLLNYKKEVSSSLSANYENEHPLVFVNFKDNNKYNVSISSFQLTRDAANPLLYNYTINMKAYNLTSALEDVRVADEDTLKKLGLDGITGSYFSKAANAARLAKNTVYAALAAGKGVGR